MTQTLATTLLPVLMIVAATTDVMSFRIPNWLTILTALSFFPLAYATGMPLETFGYHVLAGAILFAVGFGLYSFGLFGGGDAKLIAAAGLWFGMANSMTFVVLTVLAGGVLAIAVALWSALHVHWEALDSSFSKRFAEIKPNVPYGLAIAVGAIFAFPGTWWMGGAS